MPVLGARVCRKLPGTRSGRRILDAPTGHRPAMSEQNADQPPSLDLSETAEAPTEESIAEEKAIVGDEPGGDTVPEDDAQ